MNGLIVFLAVITCLVGVALVADVVGTIRADRHRRSR